MRHDALVSPRPPSALPQIVAVGFRRIHALLQALAPTFSDKARVTVLDVGFEQAVARIRQLQAQQGVDVVVAAGSNGAYLRQHLDTPVVLVKVGGFDVMQALAQAKRLADRQADHGAAAVGLVTYEGMAPDLSPFGELFGLGLQQRSYRTEDEAVQCVRELREQGVQVVVGPGTVADVADAQGLIGLFLYSPDAVREALDDAVEVARAARIELAKRERLNAILSHLSDGVVAVDLQERVQTLNPTMARWLGITPEQWLGQRLGEVCPPLSLQDTLRLGTESLETIERVHGKTLILSRMPIVEQGVLTGAVISGQDPISIQRVDRHIRTRTKPQASGPRYTLQQFMGDSAPAVALRALAEAAARSQATVLLVGESGTGKELIAQGIHAASDRRELPFVAVNCAAFTETLLESELFGYEDGAFTGARKGGKVGLFEAAHRGTLFLDEIGEMPLALQSRLLRVLQEREVLRVGATEPTPVNVRVVAATHRDLMACVQAGTFRQDLYYRLNILRLEVPPLRARLDDLPRVAEALHARVSARLGLSVVATRPWLQVLLAQAPHHGWPGNVRELENIIERLLVASVLPGQLPDAGTLKRLAPELFDAVPMPVASALRTGQQGQPAAAAAVTRPQPSEGELLKALQAHGGDRQAVARHLGISRTTLWRRLKSMSGG
ncbi:propionate catabolism operon regulatory protein PrpR [Aquabacterium lacunae]|uniref:propionate catabolism operon regulatory protein PrpR n=1 Tax=Aquabacterium lacunae TaxID=2528630 RepID=UPI001FE0FC73|nr:propionate catabolism operon regulatory protein PrpR [Aquabacterium lacunae]